MTNLDKQMILDLVFEKWQNAVKNVEFKLDGPANLIDSYENGRLVGKALAWHAAYQLIKSIEADND